MAYYFPFGQELHPLVQEDTSPKKVFVLGVYASAVHARWKKDGQIVCQALAVASEPRIFWDGDPAEAKQIIDSIRFTSRIKLSILVRCYRYRRPLQILGYGRI